MSERQWGFTPADPIFPPFFNVTERDDGTFQISVRAPRQEDGSCGGTSAMTMEGAEFRAYIQQLAADLGP